MKDMNWKFWEKENPREGYAGTKEVKLARPKELPDRLGRYLVTQLKLNQDWLWNLKCVMRPKADEKSVFEIRIFNPATAARKGVSIANYNSLDAPREMILYFGTFNKNIEGVQLEKTLKNAG